MKTKLFTAMLLFTSLGCAYGQIPLMPEDLLIFAGRNGCKQVDDFFKNRPGMLNPPYVYGYLSGSNENSAVFWCQVSKKDKRTFFLVILAKEVIPKFSACPTKIEWHNYPGGLSIYKDKQTTLDGFVELADPNRRAPSGVKLMNNAILSHYDGVEALFYCYRGKWLVRQRH